MRFALVDSGLGVLPAAMHLRRLCPGAELVLSMDPEGMPWGPRTPDDIAERALACAEATLPWKPDVLVLACNTASVRALDVLRGELEPAVPVVGTVPAIKPAAANGGGVAIWATTATTGSPYQQELIRKFADGVHVTEVACPGLADAIELADQDAIAAAVSAAAAVTPPEARAVVLGCTQYELAMDRIRGVLPRVRLYGSAPAVAAQAIRRMASRPLSNADAASTGPAGQRQAEAGGQGDKALAGQSQLGSADRQQPRPGRATMSAGPAAPAGSPDAWGSAPAASPGHASPSHASPNHTPPGSASSGPAGASGHPGEHGRRDAYGSGGPHGQVSAAAFAETPADDRPTGSDPRVPEVHILLSGAPGELPSAALRYAEGRLLAGLRLPSTAA